MANSGVVCNHCAADITGTVYPNENWCRGCEPVQMKELREQLLDVGAQLFKASNLIHQIKKLAINDIPKDPEGSLSYQELGRMYALRKVLDLIDSSQPLMAVTVDEKTARIAELEASLHKARMVIDRLSQMKGE